MACLELPPEPPGEGPDGLAAKPLNDGRRGSPLVGLQQHITAFITLTPGTCGRIIYQDLAEPDQIRGTLLGDLFGPGLRGLTVAGLVAAMISTLTCFLTPVASILTNDICRRFVDEEILKRTAVRSGRVCLFAAEGMGARGGRIAPALRERPADCPEDLRPRRRADARRVPPEHLLNAREPARRERRPRGGFVFSFTGGIASTTREASCALPQPFLALAEVNPRNLCPVSFSFTGAVIVAVSLASAGPETGRLERRTFAWYLKRRDEVEATAAGDPAADGTPRRDAWYVDSASGRGRCSLCSSRRGGSSASVGS